MFPISQGIIRWFRGLLKEPQETASGTSETCSQVLKGDNHSQRGCGKLQRDNVQGNMRGKLQRKIEIQLQTTRLASHRLQVRWESLHESSSKIESNGGWWDVWPEDQRIDLGTIYVDNDEISNSSWPGIWSNFDRMPEHELRRDQNVVWYLFEADCGEFIWNSGFIYYDVWLLAVDDNDFAPWSSDQMGQSKGTCPFWSSIVFGKNKSTFRSKHQVDRTDSLFRTRKRVCRIVWNWWRTNWIRVAYFPGITTIEILRQIQESLKARQINPDQFQGRIIFMSMFNDIGWKKNGILMYVSRMPEK